MSTIKKKLNVIFSGVAGSFNGIHQHGIVPLEREIKRYSEQSKEIDFGILYNAPIEGWFGRYINEKQFFANSIKMADSGGFQIETGVIKHGDENLKRKVYENQAAYSDYGMCFDEVPKTKEGFYDHTQALEKTLQTNANICQQIQVFKELNTKCKIFPIAKVQPEDRAISYENLLKDCDISMLAGMAANTVIFGDYFAYPFFFKEFQKKLKFPNVLHHLGTGTPQKFLPFYLLSIEGFFGKDFHYSIDATSYSHSIVLRSQIILENGKWGSFAKFSDDVFEEWRNYCKTYLPDLCEQFEAFDRIDRRKPISTREGLACVLVVSSIAYGMKMFLKIVEDPWQYALDNRVLTYHQLESIKELAKCRDWKDYYAWKGVFGSIWSGFNPTKVKPLERNNLDAFF